MKIRLKAQARLDLLAILAWGDERWGHVRSREFLEGLIEAIERLEANPLTGRSRSAFLPGLRSVRHRGYAIFHVIEDGRPVVVAVIHERRNLAALDYADRIEGD